MLDDPLVLMTQKLAAKWGLPLRCHLRQPMEFPREVSCLPASATVTQKILLPLYADDVVLLEPTEETVKDFIGMCQACAVAV